MSIQGVDDEVMFKLDQGLVEAFKVSDYGCRPHYRLVILCVVDK